MEKLNERAMVAVKRYCENQGYEVLEVFEDSLVVKDGKELVFCEVQVRAYGDSLPIEDMDRGRWESLAALYLAEHPECCDVPVRFDNFSLLVVGTDRALLRHHINALGNQ
jgi:putative endonuclease